MFPTDKRSFDMDQIHQHFNYHIKDYFTELVKQSEALSTEIAIFENTIIRVDPNDGFKQVSQNYKNLLEARKFNLIILDKIEKYRENERGNVVRIGS